MIKAMKGKNETEKKLPRHETVNNFWHKEPFFSRKDITNNAIVIIIMMIIAKRLKKF